MRQKRLNLRQSRILLRKDPKRSSTVCNARDEFLLFDLQDLCGVTSMLMKLHDITSLRTTLFLKGGDFTLNTQLPRLFFLTLFSCANRQADILLRQHYRYLIDPPERISPHTLRSITLWTPIQPIIISNEHSLK
jgi:hypothetical protein